jgi:flagellar biosynthetic protein FliR
MEFITDKNAVIFILLLSRIGGFFAFLPFFSHASISVTIKTALSLYITFLLFPLATLSNGNVVEETILFLVVSEFMIGFIAGVFLNIVFAAVSLAGSQISMIMGFSMANVFDPISGENSPLMSQILTLLAIMFFLAFDAHHMILLFLSKSIDSIVLGGFYPSLDILKHILLVSSDMFKISLILAFPIIAISILSDIIFGMLMKTMPQFNLLVVGFPIKISIALVVIVAVLGSMMSIFKNKFLNIFEYLKYLL